MQIDVHHSASQEIKKNFLTFDFVSSTVLEYSFFVTLLFSYEIHCKTITLINSSSLFSENYLVSRIEESKPLMVETKESF